MEIYVSRQTIQEDYYATSCLFWRTARVLCYFSDAVTFPELTVWPELLLLDNSFKLQKFMTTRQEYYFISYFWRRSQGRSKVASSCFVYQEWWFWFNVCRHNSSFCFPHKLGSRNVHITSAFSRDERGNHQFTAQQSACWFSWLQPLQLSSYR